MGLLKTALLTGASVVVIGLSGCDVGTHNNGRVSEPSYIEGIVVSEEMVQNVEKLPLYPYAFAIKTPEGKIVSFNVYKLNALSVNVKINVGDRIRIDKKGSLGGSVYNARYIDVIERASILSENP